MMAPETAVACFTAVMTVLLIAGLAHDELRYRRKRAEQAEKARQAEARKYDDEPWRASLERFPDDDF